MPTRLLEVIHRLRRWTQIQTRKKRTISNQPPFLQTQDGAGRSDLLTASKQAYGAVYQTLVRQTTLLAHIDNFRFLAFLCVHCLPAALLFKKGRARAGAPVMH
jgi:hypothetical protein